MSEKVECGGYIYKWGANVGCTDYTIPEEIFKKGAPEDRIYPVTDGTFCRNDPWSVLGTGKVKFDEKGVWADITVTSESAQEALRADDEEKLKLGFMINNVWKNEHFKTIAACSLRAIDIAEIGIHPIEYVSFHGKEKEDGSAT